MKHEMYEYFFTVFRKFSGKSNKKYSTGNEEWIKSETASLTGDYVLLLLPEHFISSLADKTNAFKTENGHHSINLTDDDCSPSNPVKR